MFFQFVNVIPRGFQMKNFQRLCELLHLLLGLFLCVFLLLYVFGYDLSPLFFCVCFFLFFLFAFVFQRSWLRLFALLLSLAFLLLVGFK